MMSPQASQEGEKLFAGRYQILSTLGRGGMGEVYKVYDIKNEEDLALKLLRPEIANDPDIPELSDARARLALLSN